jgi:hypothetical protein
MNTNNETESEFTQNENLKCVIAKSTGKVLANKIFASYFNENDSLNSDISVGLANTYLVKEYLANILTNDSSVDSTTVGTIYCKDTSDISNISNKLSFTFGNYKGTLFLKNGTNIVSPSFNLIDYSNNNNIIATITITYTLPSTTGILVITSLKIKPADTNILKIIETDTNILEIIATIPTGLQLFPTLILPATSLIRTINFKLLPRVKQNAFYMVNNTLNKILNNVATQQFWIDYYLKYQFLDSQSGPDNRSITYMQINNYINANLTPSLAPPVIDTGTVIKLTQVTLDNLNTTINTNLQKNLVKIIAPSNNKYDPSNTSNLDTIFINTLLSNIGFCDTNKIKFNNIYKNFSESVKINFWADVCYININDPVFTISDVLLEFIKLLSNLPAADQTLFMNQLYTFLHEPIKTPTLGKIYKLVKSLNTLKTLGYFASINEITDALTTKCESFLVNKYSQQISLVLNGTYSKTYMLSDSDISIIKTVLTTDNDFCLFVYNLNIKYIGNYRTTFFTKLGEITDSKSKELMIKSVAFPNFNYNTVFYLPQSSPTAPLIRNPDYVDFFTTSFGSLSPLFYNYFAVLASYKQQGFLELKWKKYVRINGISAGLQVINNYNIYGPTALDILPEPDNPIISFNMSGLTSSISSTMKLLHELPQNQGQIANNMVNSPAFKASLEKAFPSGSKSDIMSKKFTDLLNKTANSVDFNKIKNTILHDTNIVDISLGLKETEQALKQFGDDNGDLLLTIGDYLAALDPTGCCGIVMSITHFILDYEAYKNDPTAILNVVPETLNETSRKAYDAKIFLLIAMIMDIFNLIIALKDLAETIFAPGEVVVRNTMTKLPAGCVAKSMTREVNKALISLILALPPYIVTIAQAAKTPNDDNIKQCLNGGGQLLIPAAEVAMFFGYKMATS